MQQQRATSTKTSSRASASALLKGDGGGPSATVFESGSISPAGGLKTILLTIGVLSFLLFLVPEIPETDVEAVFGVRMPKLAQPRQLIALGIIAAFFALFSRLHLQLVESRVLGLKTFVLFSPLDRKLLELSETRSSNEEALELGEVAGAAWRLLGGIGFFIHTVIFLAVSVAVGFQLYHTLAPVVRAASMAACIAPGWYPSTQLQSLSDPCTAWIISAVGAAVALSALVKAASCLLVIAAPRRESQRVPLYFLLLVPAIPFFYLAQLVGLFRTRTALRGRQKKSAKQWEYLMKSPEIKALLQSSAREFDKYAVEVIGINPEFLRGKAGRWTHLSSGVLYRVRNEFYWHRTNQPEGPFGVSLRLTKEEANDEVAQAIVQLASKVVYRPPRLECSGPNLFELFAARKVK